MRKFDHNGMLLAEYQAKLFEKSVALGCSTGIFMRRFYHSDLLKQLDNNNSSLLSLDVNEGFALLTEQFGETNYGKNKFSRDSLFWMGYLYRYISYTREQSTGFVMKLFNYKQMNDVFYTFHTQSNEWCVQNLLELNNLNESEFDKNERLKRIISKYWDQNQTCLYNLNKQV